MVFTLTRNFKIHFHGDQDEIMPWYYVMVLGGNLLVYFGQRVSLLKDHGI